MRRGVAFPAESWPPPEFQRPTDRGNLTATPINMSLRPTDGGLDAGAWMHRWDGDDRGEGEIIAEDYLAL